MKSQQDKILELLEKGDWICSSRFYEQYIADPRTRICELRKKGFLLESRRCEAHDFHRGGSKEWKLIGCSPELLFKLQLEENNIVKEIKSRLTIDELALGINY